MFSTLVTIPKNTAFLSSLYYLSYFNIVDPLYLFVFKLGASPPPLLDKRVWFWVIPKKSSGHSVDIHQHHLVSLNSEAVITCQGDTVELGLEGCHCLEQSWITIPPIYILYHFLLNYTEHLLELWLQPWLD